MLLLVHGESYKPAVSYVLLYLTVSVIFTTAVALVLLPTYQFGEGFCAAFYILYAVFSAAATFFTGGVSSELYVIFFPLIFASALHRSWRVGLTSLGAVLLSYSLAMLPNLLEGAHGPALVFFRIASFGLAGVFALTAGREISGGDEEGYALDEDGSMLLERVSEEIRARPGARIGVMLVDPGPEIENVNLLMERVRARVGDPVLLGEGTVFGVVLRDIDDRALQTAARRAIAAASSLGAEKTRAGVATYPRDARSAEDLLFAAGGALEAAFEMDGPNAIVLANRGTGGAEDHYRAAR